MRNSFRIEGSLAFIELRRRNKPSLEAIVDVADLPLLSHLDVRFRAVWSKDSGTFYVNTHTNCPTTYLHRILMGHPDGVVDHKDWNGLNCTRENLDSISFGMNIRHKRKSPRTPTGFKGVEKNKLRYAAYCQFEGRKLYLGLFITPGEAADVAKRKRIDLGIEPRQPIDDGW